MSIKTLTNGTPNQERATNISLGAAAVAVGNAFIQLVVSFGIPLTVQQETSITGAMNALVLLVIAGSHVYSRITNERERWSHLDGPGP